MIDFELLAEAFFWLKKPPYLKVVYSSSTHIKCPVQSQVLPWCLLLSIWSLPFQEYHFIYSLCDTHSVSHHHGLASVSGKMTLFASLDYKLSWDKVKDFSIFLWIYLSALYTMGDLVLVREIIMIKLKMFHNSLEPIKVYEY